MYDLAKTIQKDRRRQACLERLAAGVAPRARSMSLGRYRITFAKEPRPLDRAA
jgi:hypothetical protein